MREMHEYKHLTPNPPDCHFVAVQPLVNGLHDDLLAMHRERDDLLETLRSIRSAVENGSMDTDVYALTVRALAPYDRPIE
jgi:hypothetical protein